MGMQAGDTPDIKAELRLPYGPEGGGFLTMQLGEMQVAVEYAPAKVELLRVLNRALFADADLPELARGWRSPAQVAEQLSYPPTVDGIRRAVMLVNRAFREAVARDAPQRKLPPLVVSKRQIGIRLSWSLTVIPPERW